MFVFQAEDGIRDIGVTGVQTCALPISLALELDVTEGESVERVVAEAERAFGSVDVLVHNSGATWGAPPDEMPPEKFDRVLAVNVRGTFLMSQAAGRRMIERGSGGTIVNVASIAGLVGGNPDYMQTVGYNSSKGAVISMTRDLATSRSEEHTSELQSRQYLVCRLLLEKKNKRHSIRLCYYDKYRT